MEYTYPAFVLAEPFSSDQPVAVFKIIKHDTKEDWSNYKGKFKHVDLLRNRDLFTRLLKHEMENHFDLYPFLDNVMEELNPQKKSEVFKFILSDILEPDHNVCWEKLIDFKSDPDTMSKYYALTKWVNDVSKKDLSLNEIEAIMKLGQVPRFLNN